MRQGGLVLAAGRVRSKKNNSKKKREIPLHQKHTTNPQQPGDRDDLKTACDKTRPTL